MTPAEEEAYRHFKDTLEADLRQNIKPVIISLTMLAEDYKQNSNVIARSIEEYIKQIPPEIKILGLYLMDSIMKNLKNTTNYTQIFEKNVVTLFTQVFECVDEQNRKALYKLRQTWNEVFQNRILYDIDVSIKRIDPAWPITAQQYPIIKNNNQTTSKLTETTFSINNLSSTSSTKQNTTSKPILNNQTNIQQIGSSSSSTKLVSQTSNSRSSSSGSSSSNSSLNTSNSSIQSSPVSPIAVTSKITTQEVKIMTNNRINRLVLYY